MPNKRELIKAITVLKDECDEHPICFGCPFHDGNKECMIKQNEPTYWSVGMIKEVSNDDDDG